MLIPSKRTESPATGAVAREGPATTPRRPRTSSTPLKDWFSPRKYTTSPAWKPPASGARSQPGSGGGGSRLSLATSLAGLSEIELLMPKRTQSAVDPSYSLPPTIPVTAR